MKSRRWFVDDALLCWKQAAARGSFIGPFFLYPFHSGLPSDPMPDWQRRFLEDLDCREAVEQAYAALQSVECCPEPHLLS